MVAKDSCLGQTRTLECKKASFDAAGTLMEVDATSWDKEPTHFSNAALWSTQIVPQMKAAAEQKNPSNVDFHFVSNGLVNMEFARVDRTLAVELSVETSSNA